MSCLGPFDAPLSVQELSDAPVRISEEPSHEDQAPTLSGKQAQTTVTITHI